MTPAIKDQLLAAFDDATLRTTGQSLEHSVQKLSKTLEHLLLWLNQMRTRELLVAALDKEENKLEEAQLAIAAPHFLPALRGAAAKRVAGEMEKEFPVASRGRKIILSPNQQAQARNFVAELFRNGAPLEACKLRASQRFGVGIRTIEQAWQLRAKLPELANKPDFETQTNG